MVRHLMPRLDERGLRGDEDRLSAGGVRGAEGALEVYVQLQVRLVDLEAAEVAQLADELRIRHGRRTNDRDRGADPSRELERALERDLAAAVELVADQNDCLHGNLSCGGGFLREKSIKL